MHLGNVFSALLAWLSVRSRNGRMLLRIEDLDPDRCRPDYIETLKRDLDWLGLDWDEEQTPQSMRADAYHAEFERLRALGLVYPCYCSRAELHAASAPARVRRQCDLCWNLQEPDRGRARGENKEARVARDRAGYSHNRTGRPAGRVHRKSCAGTAAILLSAALTAYTPISSQS